MPKILREWGQTELRSHLSLEPLAVTRKRRKKVQAVDEPASDLLRALDALDEIEWNVIVDRIVRHEWSNSAEAKFPKVKQQLGMVHNFLSRLNSAGPSQTRKLPARNFAAYFVLMDIAGIFEWLTDMEATLAASFPQWHVWLISGNEELGIRKKGLRRAISPDSKY